MSVNIQDNHGVIIVLNDRDERHAGQELLDSPDFLIETPLIHKRFNREGFTPQVQPLQVVAEDANIPVRQRFLENAGAGIGRLCGKALNLGIDLGILAGGAALRFGAAALDEIHGAARSLPQSLPRAVARVADVAQSVPRALPAPSAPLLALPSPSMVR